MRQICEITRRTLLLTLSALAGGAQLAGAAERRYPQRPIRIIVPFTGGGTLDLPTRRVAQDLGRQLGASSAYVENRPGAGGLVGINLMLAAPPNGYTLLAINTRLNQLPTLYKEATYEVERDFAPLALLCKAPLLLAVPSSLGVDSVDQLIKYIHAHPASTSYASSGVGSSASIFGEEFRRRHQLDSVHVPYQGDAAILGDLQSNRLQWFFGSPIALAAFASQRKLKLLAVTGTQRLDLLPKVPTMGEAGYPGFESVGWIGMFGQAKLPPDVRGALVKSIKAITQDPSYRSYLAQNMVIPPQAGVDFAAEMRHTDEVWSRMIRDNNIQIQ